MRIKSLILAIVMIFTAIPAVFAADEVKPTLSLPEAFVKIGTPVGTQTPFKPEHKYGSMQNAPDFTWPAISGAEKYDLIVCSDEELTDIKYSKYDLKWHYYNFPNTFEPGTYYWAIRYYIGNEVSPWSAARRFRIDPDAYEFTVPETEKLVSDIPVSHPRIWVTQETMSDFKKKYDEIPAVKSIVDTWISNTEKNLEKGLVAEPVKSANYDSLDEVEKHEDDMTYVSASTSASMAAQQAALSYIFTDDTRFADYAVKALMGISEWDVNGATSFKSQDQAFFEILKRAAMVYDWMYNYMNDEQRAKARNMLLERFDVVKDSSLSEIRSSPYNSHIWSYMPNYGIACLALLHDAPIIEEYYPQWLELYTANFVPMSNEDGGWSKGTAYWTYALARDEAFCEIMKVGGYLDYFQKPWFQNEYLFAMYMMPAGSVGSFGDESNFTRPGSSYVAGMGMRGVFTRNPVAIWVMKQVGTITTMASNYADAILFAEADNMEEKQPIDYPRAHCFIDQGMTAMHSDLMDKSRISLYFRAGKYGSYNHMHADQNSFFIEAYGEKLAAKSGYYDSYHSTHDSGFTRTTVAHNSITIDGGIGQKDDAIDCDGNTDMFVTHKDFDAVVGDGTNAYNGELDKFVRSIIYVRPDTYIVVDDLKAAYSGGSNFEWWLNAVRGVSLHEDGQGAAITGEKGKLDVRVQYPAKVTGYYSNLFSGPNLVHVPAGGRYADSEVHQRIWFETEKLQETKMVTTMNVHLVDDDGAYVKKTDGENYVKLEFEDGTIAYVSTATDNDAVITADDVEFIGTAVVFNDESVMLVGGTSLKIDGKLIAKADRDITLVAGDDLMSVSSNDDYNIIVGTDNDYISKIEKITDRKGRELSPLIGIEQIDNEAASVIFNRPAEEGKENTETVEIPENSLNIRAQKGHYSLLINDKPLPGEKSRETIGFDLIIDGQKTHYEGEAYIDPDYNLQATCEVNIPDGNYILIDKSKSAYIQGVSFVNGKVTNIVGTSKAAFKSDNEYIELKTAPTIIPEIEYSTDYQGMKDAATVVVEAENFDKTAGASRLMQGITFMSGISQMNTAEDLVEYTVNIPETGYYDIGIRYAAWQEPWPTRYLEMDGTIYQFTCTDTGGYAGNGESDLDVLRMKSHVYMEAGEHKFIMKGSAEPNTFWNFDWIAFLKTE